MSIRTRLILTLVLFGLLLVLMLVSVFLTNREVVRIGSQEGMALRIQREASELSYLSNEYLLYHEREQRGQWEAKFSAFSEDLDRLDLAEPEQRALVSNMQGNEQRLKAIFDDAVATIEGTPASMATTDPVLLQVPWSRMEVQNQAIAFDASRLVQLLHAQSDQLRQTNLVLVVAMAGLFGAFFLTNYYLVYRGILSWIAGLQAGTQMIGAGNLDFAIPVKQTDEIGNLALAFNAMAANLKVVTASKSELERQVTERQQAERLLKESEEKYRQLVENANSIVLRMDRAGKLEFINDYGLNFFGYLKEEIVGNDVRVLLPQIESGGRDLGGLADTILGNPDGFAETINENVRKNGERVWVSWRNRAFRDPEGNVIGNLAIGQDISELKRAEESLREAMRRITSLNVDLEQRAGELEVANEELERLAASLALDLRSPLIAINSVVRMISQDYGSQLPPQAQQLFELIRGNTEEMDLLTQGLVKLMRITRQPVDKSSVNPEQVVRDVLKDLESECAGRQVQIKVGYLAPCWGDPLLLKQVWTNLISNALKFTRTRQMALIEVGSRPEGDRVIYFCRDNGVGFDMSYAGTIFLPFQRFHHPDEWGGSGVGLAIVEGIVRRHGGRVWAESEEDKGASFFFHLG